MIKKIIFASIVAIHCIACANDDKKDEAASTATDSTASNTNENTASNALVSKADYDAGLVLVAQSDCLTCHKLDEKLVGPPYREVAKKYPVDTATISYLAGKIITGGAGVWGEVPMTPHPQISLDDAKTMAKYVLYLKQ